MIWGKTSAYTGSNTDIQREKRMSEYQRAMMLRPAQREMVQARMIANPYDRESTTRLERINSQVNADPFTNGRTSQSYRDAVASQLYNQPQSYSPSGQRDSAYSDAQRSAQRRQASDPSNQFTVGEINGRRVVAPQAGHYEAYQGVMARLGLGDSPSPEAFSYAMDQQRIDPNERYKADAMASAAGAKNAQAQRKLDLEREKMQSQERIKARQTMDKQGNDARKSINAVGGENGYQDYLKNFRGHLRDIKDMTSEEAASYLESQGVAFTRAGAGKFVPLPRNKWTPGLGQEVDPRDAAMNAASETPGGAVAVQDMLRKGAMSPEGQQVEGIYGRMGLPPNQALQQPQMAQQAPQAMNPQQTMESDAQGLQQAVNALQQRGMSRQQAMQQIQQSIQNMPPDKQRRALAVLQQYGDRILQAQTGR